MTDAADEDWIADGGKAAFVRFDPDATSVLAAEFPRLLEQALDDEVGIVYWAHRRTFGVPVLDGGCAIQQIGFDPFTGKALPKPLNDEWYDALEAMGIDPHGDAVPEAFRSEAWWLERGL